MTVPIVLRTSIRGFSRVRLSRDVSAAMRRLGVSRAELSVCVVGRRAMRAANRRFFRRDEPTDVIAVSQVEGEKTPQPVPLLGDVIVSLDAARSQASAAGHSVARELSILAVHGLLHTLGMDDSTPARRRAMMDRTMHALGGKGR